MAIITPNKGLIKPEFSDPASIITAVADNLDILDGYDSADKIPYTNLAMPGVGDAKGALDALQTDKEDKLWKYAGDLHAFTQNCTVSTNQNTLNTPYKSGLVTAAVGVCIATVASNGAYQTLLYLSTGGAQGQVFVQRCAAGVWDDWVLMPTANMLSNNNLLDNADFRHLINQLGQTSYDQSSKYTIDRWKLVKNTTGSVVIDSANKHINIVRTGAGSVVFEQPLEIPLDVGNPYTISIKLKDGRIFKDTVTVASTNTSRDLSIEDCLRIYISSTSVSIVNYSGTVINKTLSISWVKLEPGVYATQFVSPNPQQELAKCQRYMWVLRPESGTISFPAYTEAVVDRCFAFIPTPVPMTGLPVGVMPESPCWVATYASNTGITIADIPQMRVMANGVFVWMTPSSPLAPWEQYRLRLNTGSPLVLDANL